MMGLTGGGDNKFIFRCLIFSIAIMFLLPTCISVFVDRAEDNTIDETYQTLTSDYQNFTGNRASTTENIWTLTNITTPYLGGSYNYSEDGWLYGSSITSYSPSQYSGTSAAYTITKSSDDGFYYYSSTTQDGHTSADLCSNVTMDISKKSNIFFTANNKHSTDDGFYYDYTGYRYVFSPISDYYAQNSDGDVYKQVASKTSLSLIWYEYYTASGIAGQLVLSGSDSGVAYLTSAEIIKAFNSTNNTSKFDINFNGNKMYLYIRINPYYTSQGMSIEDCYNNGYWSVMVSSISTSVQSYTNTDYSFNIANIWDTMIGLFTFDTSQYNLSPMMGTICSLLFSTCFYAMLISIGITCYPVLLLAGIAGAIQAIATLWPF